MEPMELKIWMLVCWLIADTDMPELTCSPGSAVWDQGALPRTGCLARTEFVKNCIEAQEPQLYLEPKAYRPCRALCHYSPMHWRNKGSHTPHGFCCVAAGTSLSQQALKPWVSPEEQLGKS
ncbi:hypothetical protein AV530_010413 [Patagioenas fasciata monilis]|uniref:Secreted protein n=1 Tax=Patagioenas fasciata monilis TaxID=372326 RepID=A0A1V4KEU6_PATFA|nr:hypothetical protein AV530_010413 [Patagioenas fasciata monilis]